MFLRVFGMWSVALLSFSTPSFCQSRNASHKVKVTRVDDRHYVVENSHVLRTKEQIRAHRPSSVPAHAYFWESNQNDDFMIYGWVEYRRAADLNNNIHFLRVYDDEGSLTQEGYYAVLQPHVPLVIDYADYVVKHPLGSILRLTTRGKDFTLLYINYNHSYMRHFASTAPDKARYVTIPVYNPATRRLQPDVSLKSRLVGPNVEITMETELNESTKALYQLVNIGTKNAGPPSVPYRFKYMDPGTARIYLIEKDWVLEKL